MLFRRRRVRLRGPFALLVGVVCLGIAFYQYLTSNALAEHGIVTQARVVAIDERSRRRSSGGYRREYALTLEFRDQAGERQRERTSYERRHGSYRRGEQVQIRYNPRRPQEFAIDTFAGLWAMPLTFGAIGVIACGGFLMGSRRT